MVNYVDYNDEELNKWCKEHEEWLRTGKHPEKKKSFIEKHWWKIALGGMVAGYLIKGKLNSVGVPVPDIDPEPEWLGRECVLKGIVKKTGEELMSVDCSEAFVNDMIDITKMYAKDIEVTEF